MTKRLTGGISIYYPLEMSNIRMILIILVSLAGCQSLEDLYPECTSYQGAEFKECVDEAREYAYNEAKQRYLLCRKAYAAKGWVWHAKPTAHQSKSRDGVPDSTLELDQERVFNGCRL